MELVADQKLIKIKHWESKAQKALLQAEEKDLKTRYQIYRELNSIQKDIIKLKSMLSSSGDLAEHRQSKFKDKFDDLYKLLKKKMSDSRYLNPALKNTISPEKQNFDYDEIVEDLINAQEDLENWFAEAHPDLKRSEFEKLNSLLNKLMYFSDRTLTKLDLLNRSSGENISKEDDLQESIRKCHFYIDRFKKFREEEST